jgi:hypothetical protein
VCGMSTNRNTSTCESAWAFGFNRKFGSVRFGEKYFGFQQISTYRLSKEMKTAEFRFGF